MENYQSITEEVENVINLFITDLVLTVVESSIQKYDMDRKFEDTVIDSRKCCFLSANKAT